MLGFEPETTGWNEKAYLVYHGSAPLSFKLWWWQRHILNSSECQHWVPRRPDVGHHDGLGVAAERVLEKTSQLGIAIRNVRRFRVHLEKRSRMLYGECYCIPMLPIDGRGRITCYHARKWVFCTNGSSSLPSSYHLKAGQGKKDNWILLGSNPGPLALQVLALSIIPWANRCLN